MIECPNPKCQTAFEPRQKACQECLETCPECGRSFDPYLTCWEEEDCIPETTEKWYIPPSKRPLDKGLEKFKSINKHKHSWPENA